MRISWVTQLNGKLNISLEKRRKVMYFQSHGEVYSNSINVSSSSCSFFRPSLSSRPLIPLESINEGEKETFSYQSNIGKVNTNRKMLDNKLVKKKITMFISLDAVFALFISDEIEKMSTISKTRAFLYMTNLSGSTMLITTN